MKSLLTALLLNSLTKFPKWETLSKLLSRDIFIQRNAIYPSPMDALWKLRAEPWVALDGPRKGRLEAITLWASRDGQNPGLFLQNNGQLLAHLSQLLSSADTAHSVLSTLTQNKPIDLPGAFTTTQLRSLGFEI